MIFFRSPACGGQHPKGYVCRFAAGPMLIDGVLDERAWRAAPWTGDFVDIEGDARPAPRFRTRVKMLWDTDYLYIGADLQEPHVWATLTKRDTVIFYDNDFEVFLDPNGDNHQYYEMEINALNTVWDLFLATPYRDGGRARDGWDIAGLKTAVRIHGTLNNPADTDSGWTVEIAMPWKALGEFARRPAPPNRGDQWRINFSRVEWQVETAGGSYRKVGGTKEDNWVWSPQGVVDMHQPERWGYIQFGGSGAKPSAFKPDLSRPAQDALMSVYHAQVGFRKEHGRWATSIGELSPGPGPGPGPGTGEKSAFETPPAVSLTASGYIATVTIKLPGGKKKTWFVTENSRLWH
ncbi:MAG TPA: carbohydrate-binding family 9-like protein, partial [Bacteroidota bacterium]